MHTLGSTLRLVAVGLVVVLAVTVAAPETAHADIMTTLAIASAAIAVLIVVGYLIVANVMDKRTSENESVVGVAAVTTPAATAATAPREAGESP